MPYIGNIPAEKYAAFNVQYFTTSATATYTLDRAVANELDIRLVINNVIQEPGAGKAYTAAGTTLTLSAATAGSDTMYAVYIGKAVQTVNPGAGSVGTTALADNAVTNAKLADATQGDVIYYAAAGAPAQLSAGTNGHFLKTQGAGANPVWAAVPDSGITFAEAQRPTARPIMINGNFEAWQRGTSFTSAGYTCDRWYQDLSGATATVSRQTFTVGQSDVPSNPKYHLRQAVSTANNNCGVFYRHEDVTTVTGNITISFYAKGTNPNGGNLHIITKQDFGSGGSTAVETATQNLTLSGSWQRFVFNFSLASISGKTVGSSSYLQMLIKQPDGDSSTNAWQLDLANFQVEVGTYTTSTIPPFQQETLGSNLVRCQRYYYRIGAADGGYFGSGNIDGSNDAQILVQFPCVMRTSPSAIETNGTAAHYAIRTTFNTTCDSVPVFSNTDLDKAMVIFKKSSHGITNGAAAFGRSQNNTAYLAWSAEL